MAIIEHQAHVMIGAGDRHEGRFQVALAPGAGEPRIIRFRDIPGCRPQCLQKVSQELRSVIVIRRAGEPANTF
jgi:hypothetical protein